MSSLPPGSFVEDDTQPTRSSPSHWNLLLLITQQLHRAYPKFAQEAREAEEEREEAKSLNEAALSIPDSEADSDVASVYEPSNEVVPGDAAALSALVHPSTGKVSLATPLLVLEPPTQPPLPTSTLLAPPPPLV